jgi:hypothetical protein
MNSHFRFLRSQTHFTGVALRSSVVAGLTLVLSACGGAESPDGPRVTVVPVTGKVVVDGEPAAGIAIRCLPIGEKPTELPTSSAFTDAEGNFAISTFESGDGAPPGEYRLTFEWLTLSLLNGRYEGPDKLGNQYSDPEKSEHMVMVVEGLPTEVGTIELKKKQEK